VFDFKADLNVRREATWETQFVVNEPLVLHGAVNLGSY
jgi:hypothetical protein